MQVNSRVVWDYMCALNELGSRVKVTIAGVSGQEAYRGNEKADELARKASSMAFIGPERSCGIVKIKIKTAIRKWIEDKSRERWRKFPDER